MLRCSKATGVKLRRKIFNSHRKGLNSHCWAVVEEMKQSGVVFVLSFCCNINWEVLVSTGRQRTWGTPGTTWGQRLDLPSAKVHTSALTTAVKSDLDVMPISSMMYAHSSRLWSASAHFRSMPKKWSCQQQIWANSPFRPSSSWRGRPRSQAPDGASWLTQILHPCLQTKWWEHRKFCGQMSISWSWRPSQTLKMTSTGPDCNFEH